MQALSIHLLGSAEEVLTGAAQESQEAAQQQKKKARNSRAGNTRKKPATGGVSSLPSRLQQLMHLCRADACTDMRRHRCLRRECFKCLCFSVTVPAGKRRPAGEAGEAAEGEAEDAAAAKDQEDVS